MWLFLAHLGFYSIVVKPDDTPDTLTVRTRVRADLERFREAAARLGYDPVDEEIRVNVATDYPYRLRFQRAAVAQVLIDYVQTTKVSNFKSAVKKTLGRARAYAYGRVWSALYDLERTER